MVGIGSFQAEAGTPAGHAQTAKKKCKKKARKCKHKRPSVAPPVTSPSTPSTPGTARVTLTVAPSPANAGTIDSDPVGISCGTICSAQFDRGTVVHLTTTHYAGFRHKDWTGGGCSGAGACDVTLNGTTTVIAEFVERVTVTFTASLGGTVTGSAPGAPFGVCSSSSCTVDAGDNVHLTAAPDSGQMLDQWTGDCSGSSLTVDFMSISSPDRLCTANFVALTP